MLGVLMENIIGGMIFFLILYDFKRLELYVSNLVDYYLVRYEYLFLSLSIYQQFVSVYCIVIDYIFLSNIWICRVVLFF